MSFKIDSIIETEFNNINRINASSINNSSTLTTDVHSKYFDAKIGDVFDLKFVNKIDQQILNEFDYCMNGIVFKVDGNVSYISYGGLLMKIDGIDKDVKKDDKISCLIRHK